MSVSQPLAEVAPEVAPGASAGHLCKGHQTPERRLDAAPPPERLFISQEVKAANRQQASGQQQIEQYLASQRCDSTKQRLAENMR